jgi:hypothetical protein
MFDFGSNALIWIQISGILSIFLVLLALMFRSYKILAFSTILLFYFLLRSTLHYYEIYIVKKELEGTYILKDNIYNNNNSERYNDTLKIRMSGEAIFSKNAPIEGEIVGQIKINDKWGSYSPHLEFDDKFDVKMRFNDTSVLIGKFLYIGTDSISKDFIYYKKLRL